MLVAGASSFRMRRRSVTVRPIQKNENNVLQSSRGTSADKMRISPTAHHPFGGRLVMIFSLGKRDSYQRRAAEIDLNRHAGIIQRGNPEAVAVLPIAIAAAGIPL